MASESTSEHRNAAAADESSKAVACAVITVSDTRTAENDRGGDLIVRLLEEARHRVIGRALVKDEVAEIGAALDGFIADAGVRAVLMTGGTGISKRDTTVEVVRERLVAEMEGFGELFRMLSWEQVKGAAMLSRAVAGIATHEAGGDTFVFAMPGSTNAVETAMVNLVVPELSHLVWERL